MLSAFTDCFVNTSLKHDITPTALLQLESFSIEIKAAQTKPSTRNVIYSLHVLCCELCFNFCIDCMLFYNDLSTIDIPACGTGICTYSVPTS